MHWVLQPHPVNSHRVAYWRSISSWGNFPYYFISFDSVCKIKYRPIRLMIEIITLKGDMMPDIEVR